jgi:Raf kinase inhibitor-like YbhB/YbcL family protein
MQIDGRTNFEQLKKLNDMKKRINFLLLLTVAAIGNAQTFTLKSSELGGQFTNRYFMNGFGYSGENISPQLSWQNAPAGTQSFAVTMYDKDAPTGSGLWHWVVFNIPTNVTELPSNAGDIAKKLMPVGAVQSMNDIGNNGYVGPAPPAGPSHQYVITVYALKSKIDLKETATAALVGFYLNSAALAKASIVAYAQHP